MWCGCQLPKLDCLWAFIHRHGIALWSAQGSIHRVERGFVDMPVGKKPCMHTTLMDRRNTERRSLPQRGQSLGAPITFCRRWLFFLALCCTLQPSHAVLPGPSVGPATLCFAVAAFFGGMHCPSTRSSPVQVQTPVVAVPDIPSAVDRTFGFGDAHAHVSARRRKRRHVRTRRKSLYRDRQSRLHDVEVSKHDHPQSVPREHTQKRSLMQHEFAPHTSHSRRVEGNIVWCFSMYQMCMGILCGFVCGMFANMLWNMFGRVHNLVWNLSLRTAPQTRHGIPQPLPGW